MGLELVLLAAFDLVNTVHIHIELLTLPSIVISFLSKRNGQAENEVNLTFLYQHLFTSEVHLLQSMIHLR